jgi:hypothetical protein
MNCKVTQLDQRTHKENLSITVINYRIKRLRTYITLGKPNWVTAKQSLR